MTRNECTQRSATDRPQSSNQSAVWSDRPMILDMPCCISGGVCREETLIRSPLTHGRSDTAFTTFSTFRPAISRNWRPLRLGSQFS